MISIATLWMPILLASVFVFVASAILQMVLGYHWKDMKQIPQQQAFLDSLRGLSLPPGDYMAPMAADRAAMRDPAFMEQLNRGPVVRLTVLPNGMNIGGSLLKWFVYVLLISICCAYIASRELAPGVHYLSVFRLTGFAAFAAYALALPQASIWYGRSWRMTILSLFDGLVYGALTGGTFGWLWPHMA